MAALNTYTCDGCGTVKKETNHWFLMQVTGTGIHIMTWNSVTCDTQGVTHICGIECLMKATGKQAANLEVQSA